MSSWKNRDLTPLGRIIVLKSLVVSVATHLFLCIPGIDNNTVKEINSLFFSFVWNGKRDKVKRTTMCQPYVNGGLRMIDVQKFISSLKITWMRKIFNSESSWKRLLVLEYPQRATCYKFGSLFLTSLRIQNPFWREFFSEFKAFCQVCVPRNMEEFRHEPLFFNHNVKSDDDNNTADRWVGNGVWKIDDIFDGNGCALTYGTFCELFDRNDITFVEYYGRVAAVRAYRARLEAVWSGECADVATQYRPYYQILKRTKGTDGIYNILVRNTSPAICMRVWNDVFPGLEWEKVFLVPRSITKDTKLRWFQFRLTHRILTTNVFAHRIGLTDTSLCSFCSLERETIEHLLWNCNVVKKFIEEFCKKMKDKCDHLRDFILDKQLFLLGITKTYRADKPLQLIILMLKQFIYRCKCTGKELNQKVFLWELENRYYAERYMYAVKDMKNMFKLLWSPYYHLFSSVNIQC